MSTDQFVVDEVELAKHKPAPCDLRRGPELARVKQTMQESIALVSADQKAFAGEVATLTSELAAAHKAVAALAKVDKVPADVMQKLTRVEERLAEFLKNEDIKVRVLAAKKMELQRWLEEGTPPNSELIDADSLVDKALASVRRIFA